MVRLPHRLSNEPFNMKIFLKFDATIATKPVILLKIVAIRTNLISS